MEGSSLSVTHEQPVSVLIKATLTVKATGRSFSNLDLTRPLDDNTSNLLGKTFLLELVSAELDPDTRLEKETIESFAQNVSHKDDEVTYESEIFEVPPSFGMIGAVLLKNEHHEEIYLMNIVMDGFPSGPVHLTCNSWIHSKHDNPDKRIFFTHQSYLPSKTPSGLIRLRKMELENLRGNGEGGRKSFERIYDYDTYNDLGNPEKSTDFARSVLGGTDHPYPRRCRTGRPHYEKDPLSEQRSSSVYVPRDEAFSEVKQETFSRSKLKYVVPHLKTAVRAVRPQLKNAVLHPSTTVRAVRHQLKNLVHHPSTSAVKNAVLHPSTSSVKNAVRAVRPQLKIPVHLLSRSAVNLGFPSFEAIDSLFKKRITLPEPKNKAGHVKPMNLLRRAKKDFGGRFEIPEMIARDKFAWSSDEEFSRQTLAGLNPFSIQLVQEWPLKSKLDPEIYGSPESLITTKLVEQDIGGIMTVEEALQSKRLFMLDYHDLLLPYVNKVRELEGTTLYGSRTLFFLTEDGTLKLLAIELTRPPSADKPQWKKVFPPSSDATGLWLWRLAKAHVCAHDSAYHQLVIHWLRTHCCTEPYIIAANRQLSAMHPIYRLLHPHFRYTMKINALARESLINAGGVIESTFSPGKYSIELSSVAYDQLWRFDMEALPADLIRRGMAVEDPTAEHGLRLMIKDYPFANDGLILWDAIKQWVSYYVNHYYPEPSLVQADEELQAWWTEVRTVGHTDKKDEPWWPVLKNTENLTQVLTTIIWVTSGHHAAVNFGQYMFAGYFPNRPTIARTNMPTEDPSGDEIKKFMTKPEDQLMKCFPSQIQATKVMAVLHVLSNHSPDEEYVGKFMESSWEENPAIKAAFEHFSGRLKKLEEIIDERNNNLDLKNRAGTEVVPYELLKPFSKPGVSGRGVPNSISI